MKITLGLAEDNQSLVKSISRNLACFDNVELLFISRNGIELLEQLKSFEPMVMLMDINMPGMNGIEATRKVRELFPEMKIIMFTVFDTDDMIFNSILAGASGYLLKDASPSKLLEAIEEAVEGGAPMSPSIAVKALQLLRSQHAPEHKVDKENNEFDLTSRELEILEKISESKNYQEIADVLFISPKTVRKHIENIYRKLQVHNKMDAVKIARFNKLL